MTDKQNEQTTQDAPKQDWNELAKEALDLWQNHLSSLASDPKVKEDMTRFVTPMTQMFSQWTDMMQNGLQGMPGFTMPTPPAGATMDDDDHVHTDATDQVDSATTDGAPADVQSEASSNAAGANAGSSAGDTAGSTSPAASQPSAAVEPQPVYEPVSVATPAAAPVPAAVAQPAPIAAPEPAARGRTASTDGSRDLAQLASRLAELERELDSLRPKPKRVDTTEPALDSAADGAVQRVARAD